MVRFLVTIFLWSIVGRVTLELVPVHPMAIAIVWFVGLIWLIGWSVTNAEDADYLLLIMVGMLTAPWVVAGLFILSWNAFN